jgi:hypothetical protein
LGFIGHYTKPSPLVVNGLDLKRRTELLTEENKSKIDIFAPKIGWYCRLTEVGDCKTDGRDTFHRSMIRPSPVMGGACECAGEIGEKEDKAPVVVG